MKAIMKYECYHILSEPGDGTRYDYFFIHNEGDYFFINRIDTFNYPARIEAFEVCEINNKNDKRIQDLAKEKDCNPWTYKECLRTIHEYKKGMFI